MLTDQFRGTEQVAEGHRDFWPAGSSARPAPRRHRKLSHPPSCFQSSPSTSRPSQHHVDSAMWLLRGKKLAVLSPYLCFEPLITLLILSPALRSSEHTQSLRHKKSSCKTSPRTKTPVRNALTSASNQEQSLSSHLQLSSCANEAARKRKKKKPPTTSGQSN